MTANARGNGRIVSSLREADGKGVGRMEDRFDTDIDDLWSALTDPGRLARWLGEVDGELLLGGYFRARFVTSEWEGACRVEACESEEQLLVLTTETGEANEHAIEVTLTADADADADGPGHRGTKYSRGPACRLRGRAAGPR